MKIFYHESFKLIKDKQVRVVFLALCFQTIFGFLLSVNRDDFFHTTPAFFLENNSDPAVLFILMGFVSASIFGADFSYRTYKNLVPFVGKRKIFINKMITLFTSIAGILMIDITLNIAIAFVMTGKIANFLDIISLFKRYFAFYIIIIFLSAFLILCCILTQNRALTYVMAVALPLLFSALPVGYNHYTVWDIFEKMYMWNANPLNITTVIFITVNYICLFDYLFISS